MCSGIIIWRQEFLRITLSNLLQSFFENIQSNVIFRSARTSCRTFDFPVPSTRPQQFFLSTHLHRQLLLEHMDLNRPDTQAQVWEKLNLRCTNPKNFQFHLKSTVFSQFCWNISTVYLKMDSQSLQHSASPCVLQLTWNMTKSLSD